MPYIDFNGRFDIPDDASDGVTSISGRARFVKSNGNIPPLLIFTGLVSGVLYNSGNGLNKTKSICVINLKTLKSTKNSYLQIELSSELKNIIISELNIID
jgi:hypothetical protein